MFRNSTDDRECTKFNLHFPAIKTISREKKILSCSELKFPARITASFVTTAVSFIIRRSAYFIIIKNEPAKQIKIHLRYLSCLFDIEKRRLRGNWQV